jgi:hypothetical protein
MARAVLARRHDASALKSDGEPCPDAGSPRSLAGSRPARTRSAGRSPPTTPHCYCREQRQDQYGLAVLGTEPDRPRSAVPVWLAARERPGPHSALDAGGPEVRTGWASGEIATAAATHLLIVQAASQAAGAFMFGIWTAVSRLRQGSSRRPPGRRAGREPAVAGRRARGVAAPSAHPPLRLRPGRRGSRPRRRGRPVWSAESCSG